jgi:hypothetical protein
MSNRLDNLTIKRLTLFEGKIVGTIYKLADEEKITYTELTYILLKISNNMASGELVDRIKRKISIGAKGRVKG